MPTGEANFTMCAEVGHPICDRLREGGYLTGTEARTSESGAILEVTRPIYARFDHVAAVLRDIWDSNDDHVPYAEWGPMIDARTIPIVSAGGRRYTRQGPDGYVREYPPNDVTAPVPTPRDDMDSESDEDEESDMCPDCGSDPCENWCPICDNCSESRRCECCHDCGNQYCTCCGTCGRDRDSGDCECCSECGSSENHYCSDCDGYTCNDSCDCNSGPILSYGHNPDEVEFRSHNDTIELRCYSGDYPDAPDDMPYLGLEIECEAAHCNAGDVAKMWQDSGLGWSSYDGSLSDGAECKTHPSTYAYLRDSNLASTLTKMGDLGARAWGYSSCGLHIHISRKAFASKSHQWRFAHLHVACLQNELIVLAGRKGVTHYCQFPHETNNETHLMDGRGNYVRDADNNYVRVKEMPTGVIAGKHAKMGRSVAVNVEEKTLEMRYWKGSLNPKSVLGAAAVEDGLIQYTRNMPFAVIRDNPTWDDFTLWAKDNLDQQQNTHIRDLCQARGVDYPPASNESEEV